MKTQKASLKYVAISGLLIICLLAGCKKVDTTRKSTTNNSVSQTAIALDDLTVNDEFEQAMDDAIIVLNNHKATIAGAYVDISHVSSGVIEIDYSGIEPDGVKARTCSDSIHFNTKIPWGTAGATATISFHDAADVPAGASYEVQYYSIITTTQDSASLTFLGGATITNKSGGSLPHASSTDSLVVQVTTNNTLFTFNDNATVIQAYALNVNELRVFTMNDSILYATTRGNDTINGTPNIGNWGVDVFGNNYYAVITKPIVQNVSNLSLSYNPLSGVKNIEEIAQPITSIYGVNSQGSPQQSAKPYGFSFSWVNNGTVNTLVSPYYY